MSRRASASARRDSSTSALNSLAALAGSASYEAAEQLLGLHPRPHARPWPGPGEPDRTQARLHLAWASRTAPADAAGSPSARLEARAVAFRPPLALVTLATTLVHRCNERVEHRLLVLVSARIAVRACTLSYGSAKFEQHGHYLQLDVG